MSEAKPQFKNFKEAFCAYHRCSEAAYARKALFLGIPFTRRLLAYPIYLFNRSFFAIDFGILDSLGEARSEEEFTGMLDELSATSRVERSIRRGVVGIRISGTRLMSEWDQVARYVKPPESTAGERGRVTPRATGERPVNSEAISREAPLPAVVARRLHRAAKDVTTGKSMDQSALDAGLTGEAEFRKLLAQHCGDDPALRWLNTQLEQSVRIRELENEVAGLRVLLGERELLIRELRGGGSPPQGPG
jgi:hypothetical protein